MLKFNQIDENNIQIYGTVVGFAERKHLEGRHVWQYKIKFIKGYEHITITSNPKNATLNTVDKLKEKVQEVYNRKMQAV